MSFKDTPMPNGPSYAELAAEAAGLPIEHADRLHGETYEELLNDARDLKALFDETRRRVPDDAMTRFTRALENTIGDNDNGLL